MSHRLLPGLRPGLTVRLQSQGVALNAEVAHPSGEVVSVQGHAAQVLALLSAPQVEPWTVASVAERLACPLEQVCVALDVLADLHVLEQRALPPAHQEAPGAGGLAALSRGMGRRTLALMGLAAAAAPMAMAATVAEEQNRKKSQEADRKSRELSSDLAASAPDADAKATPRGEAEAKVRQKEAMSLHKAKEQEKKVQQQDMKTREQDMKKSGQQDARAREADEKKSRGAQEESAKR